jgi:hypothetical protein
VSRDWIGFALPSPERLNQFIVRELLWALFGQEKAVANARAAATAMSRRRVERDEVELYLESLDADADADADVASVSPDAWGGAPARAAD